MQKKLQYLETENMSLAEWLTVMANPPEGYQFNRFEFPTQKHFKEYVSTIESRDNKEVINLLRCFLIHSGVMELDLIFLENFPGDKTKFLDVSEYHRRLMLYFAKKSPVPPWEGITWVLDLLPHSPQEALKALDAYFLAHAQTLPDTRLQGLDEAMQLIRAKFIGFPKYTDENIRFLMALDSRDFEHLVNQLYHEMGYITELTPPKKDGGRDIIIKNSEPGKEILFFVECKRHHNSIGVEIARALLGVVFNEKANKGVLVTTSQFTKGCKELANKNPHLELIDGGKLVVLLNEQFNAYWPLNIEKIIRDSKQREESRK